MIGPHSVPILSYSTLPWGCEPLAWRAVCDSGRYAKLCALWCSHHQRHINRGLLPHCWPPHQPPSLFTYRWCADDVHSSGTVTMGSAIEKARGRRLRWQRLRRLVWWNASWTVVSRAVFTGWGVYSRGWAWSILSVLMNLFHTQLGWHTVWRLLWIETTRVWGVAADYPHANFCRICDRIGDRINHVNCWSSLPIETSRWFHQPSAN